MRNVREYIYGFAGRIIPQMLSLLTNIVLARFLTTDDFGMIGVLSVFISIASTMTEAGFGGSLINAKEVSPLDCSSISIFNLGVGSFCYLLMVAFSGVIRGFFNIDGLDKVICVLSLIFVINALNIVPRSLLMKRLKFDQLAKAAIISVIAASAVSILIAFLDGGVYALVAYQLTYYAIECIALRYYSRYHMQWHFSTDSIKRLFPFGFFTTITGIIDSVYENIMTFLFGRFVNLNVAGLFYQAKKLESSATSSLVMTVNLVSFPILSKIKETKEAFLAESKQIYQTFIAVIFPPLFIVALYAEEILRIIYGVKWVAAAPYLSLLMIVGMVYIMESLMRNNLKSLGEVKVLAKYTLVKRILGLGLIVVALIIEPMAMLYGYLISTFMGYMINLWAFSRSIGTPFGTYLISTNAKLISVVIVLALMYLVKTLCAGYILQIAIFTIMAIFYYFFVLKWAKIVNLPALISTHLKR